MSGVDVDTGTAEAVLLAPHESGLPAQDDVSSAASEQRRRSLQRREAELQEKRKRLFDENCAKWPSFVAELDHTAQHFTRQAVLTSRSLLKGTKHDDTIRKAVKQVAQRANQLTATDAAVQSAEKMMGIHATVRLASIDTVPFKVSLISSSVRTVADQQEKLDAATAMLEEALKNVDVRPRSLSRRSLRSNRDSLR